MHRKEKNQISSDSDTSAASGRAGRFSAYTLDAALFMEPRLRNIEVVKFWEQDEQRRPSGVRESPTYALLRIHDVLNAEDNNNDKLSAVLEQISNDEIVSQNSEGSDCIS